MQSGPFSFQAFPFTFPANHAIVSFVIMVFFIIFAPAKKDSSNQNTRHVRNRKCRWKGLLSDVADHFLSPVHHFGGGGVSVEFQIPQLVRAFPVKRFNFGRKLIHDHAPLQFQRGGEFGLGAIRFNGFPLAVDQAEFLDLFDM